MELSSYSKNEAVKRSNSLLQNQTRVWTMHHLMANQQTCSSWSQPKGSQRHSHLAALSLLNCLSTWWNQVLHNHKPVTLIKWSGLWCQMSKKLQLKKRKRSVKEAASSDKPLIVAVTACTTGIAHTYMAEASFNVRGKQWCYVRVETTTAHLVSATVWQLKKSPKLKVIIAADKAVETASFLDGQKLIPKPVAGIRQTEELDPKPSWMAKQMSSTRENAAEAKRQPRKLSLRSLLRTLDEWGFKCFRPLSVVSWLPLPSWLTQFWKLLKINCLVLVLISCISSTI